MSLKSDYGWISALTLNLEILKDYNMALGLFFLACIWPLLANISEMEVGELVVLKLIILLFTNVNKWVRAKAKD